MIIIIVTAVETSNLTNALNYLRKSQNAFERELGFEPGLFTLKYRCRSTKFNHTKPSALKK
jgi:hypothetical protein